MVSIYDVPPVELIKQAAEQLKSKSEISPPAFAPFVKTGASRERPPLQSDWWYTRAAAVLRTVYKDGAVGVSKLRSKYGGKKNRGVKPEKFYKGSGKIIRTVLQQLEKAGLVTQTPPKEIKKGRVITPAGQALLDSAANKVAAELGLIKAKKK